MSRKSFPFAVEDVSVLARGLERQLAAHDGLPGHVELLNMLARAGGFRNFQHYRTQAETLDRLAEPAVASVPIDTVRLRKIARSFDVDGRLVGWPGKANHRVDCLWVLWSRVPARVAMDEFEINRRLNAEHAFGDPALLRRELVDHGLMRRTPDGRDYRRIELSPPPEARALIALIGRRAERH